MNNVDDRRKTGSSLSLFLFRCLFSSLKMFCFCRHLWQMQIKRLQIIFIVIIITTILNIIIIIRPLWQMQIEAGPSHRKRADRLRPSNSSRIFLGWTKERLPWVMFYTFPCSYFRQFMSISSWTSSHLHYICSDPKKVTQDGPGRGVRPNLKVKRMTGRDIWAIWNGPRCLFNSIDLI